MVRNTTPALQQAAREMRRVMTPAEAVLWAALRRKQLGGLRFRSQHPVGPFILDFYCAQHRLVVEVDGPIHLTQSERDAARTEQLERFGYRVLRFTNEQVLGDMQNVLTAILEATKAP